MDTSAHNKFFTLSAHNPTFQIGDSPLALRYQKQLSDACFFVTRAIKGVNLLTEKLAAGAPNTAEMREKVNTLTTAVSEQLSKIMFILNEPLRELPPPVFDESELQEMASRYQMAFKELNDAYLRYVESFQHWQETRTRASPLRHTNVPV